MSTCKENQENDYIKMIAVILMMEEGSSNLEGPGGKAPGVLAVLHLSFNFPSVITLLFSL